MVQMSSKSYFLMSHLPQFVKGLISMALRVMCELRSHILVLGTCQAKEQWLQSLKIGRKKIGMLYIVFSDESKFDLFGSDGKRYCCRRKGDWYKERNVKKTMKHGGGSLMVWGCIMRWRTGQLIQLKGNMDWFQYMEILKQGLLGTVCDYDFDTDSIYFQQEGNSKHTMNLLQWSGQSPDLNIIEPA